jgi:Trk K+ transport system NAD-binding subunit
MKRRRLAPHVRAPVRFLIYLRFARYLLWEFRWSLGVFTVLVLGGGWILHRFYENGALSYARACHAVFLLIFLESSLEFPNEWYLQPLFFLLPIVGLGAIADSVVRLAYLIFTRKQNLPEWNRMLASLCRNHFIVIGVGKVGYQVIRQLLELRETVVAIEMASGSPLLGELFDKGVPVIQGNARSASVLEQAGVRKARSVIITTSDDLTNLDAAITARDLNATAKIVIRLFDETLATKVAGAFSMPTISTSQVAAPAFIAAATGRKIYQGFQLAGQYVHFTDLTICPSGRLVGWSVGELQADKRINIVMQQGSQGVNVNPDAQIVLEPGDTILVIAPMDALLTLESMNQPHEEAAMPAPLDVKVGGARQTDGVDPAGSSTPEAGQPAKASSVI